MKPISRLSLSHMRNIEFSGFNNRILVHVNEAPSIANSDEGKAYIGAVSAYNKALKADQGVTFKEVQAAHKLTCQAWSSLMSQAKLVYNFKDEAINAKADEIIDLLNRRGNPSKKPYDDAYAIIQEQLTQLEEIPHEDLAKIYCDRWVRLLRERYDQFLTLKARFSRSNAAGEQPSVKETRKALEAAYHKLCEYIIAAATFLKTDEVIDLNNAIAQIVDAKRLTTKQQKGRDKDDNDGKGKKDGKDANADDENDPADDSESDAPDADDADDPSAL